MTGPQSMLAATYTQGGAFAVSRIVRPSIRADDILLRVRTASICATDVKIIRNGHRKLAPGQQIVLGHEFAGIIEEVGDRVDDYLPGQRVGVVPNAGCGHCSACTSGRANYCPSYTAFGIDRNGGHTAFVQIPGRFLAQGNIVRLPAEVSDEEASLLEPFSCVVNGVRAARVRLGDTVVIYGAGPMGLMHALLCRQAGAARIITVDPLEQRLEQARKRGCDLTLNPGEVDVPGRVSQETEGRGADVVITACPRAEVQSEAVRILAPFGRLCLFGGLPRGEAVPIDTNAIHYRNLVVTGTTGGSVEDYRIALKLVAGKRVDLLQMVSHVFPLDDLQSAYATALAGAAGKIVLVSA